MNSIKSKKIKISKHNKGEKQYHFILVFPRDEDVNSECESESCKEKNRKNVLHYSLSDKQYIDMGWTVLPKHKFMKKEKVYLPTLHKKQNDWISNNEGKTMLAYKSGELLAEFKKKSISKIYYKEGKTAIDVNKCEMNGYNYLRYILRNDENDALLAIFDTLGRGVVTDDFGKTRIKYNQIEGVLLDPTVGTPRTWKWYHDADKPEYENVMFDTYVQPPDESINKMIQRETDDRYRDQMSVRGYSETNCHKDDDTVTNEIRSDTPPKRSRAKKNQTARQENPDEKLKNVELKRENTKLSIVPNITIFKNTKIFKHQQIKPITVKINNYLTLKIINRKKMYITFLHDCWVMKIDLGVELTNECIESYLIDPEFASTDYEIVLSKVNQFLQLKLKNKRKKNNRINAGQNIKKKLIVKKTSQKTT